MLRDKLTRFFEIIDIFSYPPSFLFTFKGKFRYSTTSTKIMTILIGILTIMSFFYFGRNFINKANPFMTVTEEYGINPSPISMNRETFLFTFAMENVSNSNRPFIDESIYKVNASCATRSNEKTNKSYLTIEKCQLENIPSQNLEIKNYFINNNYSQMYCFQNYSQVLLNGTWDSEIFKDIRIQIRACDNKTDNNTCKSSELINSMLEGSYLIMHYLSVQTNFDDYDSPIKMFAVDDFQPTSLKYGNNYYIYFGKVKIETDNGFLSENIITNENMKFISTKSGNNLPQPEPGEAFITVYLRLAGITQITKRKYDNFLDVLSKIGGIIRIFTIMGALLLKPFLEQSILQRVSNETFDYEEVINYENNKSNKVDRIILSHKKQIKLYYWEYIKSKFQKKQEMSKKMKILIQSINAMKKNLDISCLVNRLIDIEKLKIFMNNKDFEAMIDKKPTISLSEQNSKKFNNDFEKKFHDKFLIKANSNFLKNGEVEIINEKKQTFSNIEKKEIPPDLSNIKNLLNADNTSMKFENENQCYIYEMMSNSERKDLTVSQNLGEKQIDSNSDDKTVEQEQNHKEINLTLNPKIVDRKN